MEKSIKPENLFIRRNRALTAIAAVIQLALAAALIIAFPVAILKNPIEEKQIFILLIISITVLSFILLFMFVLNVRNLFFPYLLTADEKGVYNFSGFFHYGFVAWQDIKGFTNDASLIDIIDSDMPTIKIYLTDIIKYKQNATFYKKWLLFWSRGEIKVYTLCSQIKRKQLFTQLNDMLNYYGTTA